VLKITGGQHRGRIINSPKGTQTRPSSAIVRQALFNRLGHQLSGVSMLDLFAGSGAVGIEALSRGASHVTFVESHRLALQALDRSLQDLSIAEECYIIKKQSVERFLAACSATFDIIFVDPPYDLEIEGLPAIIWVGNRVLTGSLLKPGGSLILESRSSAQLKVPQEWPAPTVKHYGEATLTWIG